MLYQDKNKYIIKLFIRIILYIPIQREINKIINSEDTNIKYIIYII